MCIIPTIRYSCEIIEQISHIAYIAGLAIMKVYTEYSNLQFGVFKKPDHTPVTDADLFSNQIIVDLLRNLTPDIPVISEENLPIWEECRKWNYFWLVDPLDGTKEFLSRNGEFTVNIAFIRHGEPIIGVIYVPAYDILYTANNHYAWKINSKRKKSKICVKLSNHPIIVISRSHSADDQKKLKNYLKNIKNHTVFKIGSSLKFCLIAEGFAQFYPRFSATKIWDTAAGHVIAKSAGALINDWNGYPLNYQDFNKSFINSGFQVSLY